MNRTLLLLALVAPPVLAEDLAEVNKLVTK